MTESSNRTTARLIGRSALSIARTIKETLSPGWPIRDTLLCGVLVFARVK
jgi:hypothetical protein